MNALVERVLGRAHVRDAFGRRLMPWTTLRLPRSPSSCWKRAPVPGRPSFLEDLPDGGGGHLDPESEEFAVDAAIPPTGILPCKPQHQEPDGADGPRPSQALRPGGGGV